MAAAMGMQAASKAIERLSPSTALQLNPDNGEALARQAFEDFTVRVGEGAKPEEASSELASMALQAQRYEPLNPRAHAMLAWSAETRDKGMQVLNAGLTLNRRSLQIQGMALQRFGENEDIERFVVTLDQILRVHPERLEELGPSLVQALRDEQSIEVFAFAFAKESPWHRRFLATATVDGEAAINLAKLSRRIAYQDMDLDKLIVARLVSLGETEAAASHRRWSIERQGESGATAIAADAKWPVGYPPLDWKFSEETSARAQLSRDEERVEVYVRSGRGGELISRMFGVTQSEYTLAIAHSFDEGTGDDNLRAQLFCNGRGKAFFDESLSDISPSRAVTISPSKCGFVELKIVGRAYTGQPAIRGEISSIRLTPA
jgi:hypothetical protein